MELACRHAGLSDRGTLRTVNEDRWTADPELGLYLVADGLGGHLSGALAATIVAETFVCQVRQILAVFNETTEQAFAEKLGAAVCEMSATLAEQTHDEIGLEGLGATLVALLVHGRLGTIIHLGDSRAYLQRNGALSRLTTDHTLAQVLVDSGDLHPEAAAGHSARHQLTRFIGMADCPPPDVLTIGLQAHDRILLCSDGLSGQVGERELCETMNTSGDLETVCRSFIMAANAAGGADNVTALVIEFTNAPEERE